MTLESLTPILFYVFAGVAVAAALVMITQKNPIGSAFALIVVLCSLSAIYGLLGSPFIAALQIVVYAGAVMVLFLFVIMLLNVRREADAPGGQAGLLRAAALGFVAVFVVEVSSVVLRARIRVVPNYDASTARVAQELFSPRFLYAFEATSILILAALVGAIALAKKEL
jgi:NADH-quinone oxidoreductase subunit J